MGTVDGLSRDDKIKRIYEVVSSKQIYLWNSCPRCGEKVFYETYGDVRTSYERLTCQKCGELNYDEEENIEEKEYERILPVMIGDVLDYVVEPDDTQNITEYKHIDICRSWDWKRLPIEKQLDNCIDDVYLLLKTNQPTT